MTILSQYYHELYSVTRPITLSTYANVVAFVSQHIESFLINDYQIIFCFVRDIVDTTDITKLVEDIVRYLYQKLPIDISFVTNVAIRLISTAQMQKEAFTTKLQSTSFVRLVEDVILTLLTAAPNLQTKFDIAVLLSFLPKVDTYKDFVTSILTENKTFITTHQRDILNGYKLPEYIYYEQNPYLAKHYINSNIEEEYEQKREEACKRLETYCMLIGIAYKIPSIDMSEYYLPITYIPILHETFDDLFDEYNVEYELDYLTDIITSSTKGNEEATEEVVEYLTSQFSDNDNIYISLIQRLTM